MAVSNFDARTLTSAGKLAQPDVFGAYRDTLDQLAWYENKFDFA